MPGRPALAVRLHEGADQNTAWLNPAVQSPGVIGPLGRLQRTKSCLFVNYIKGFIGLSVKEVVSDNARPNPPGVQKAL